MSVNIEHFQIDQETEFAVESVLTIAKSNGYDGNFATAHFNDDEFLPGGNVIKFLDKVLEIASDVLGRSKSPRDRRILMFAMNKIMNFRTDQSETFANTGEFMKFPTSPFGVLSDHLKR